MFVFATNPFIAAYLQSDWFGKAIFWGLFVLSVLSWVVLLHKSWILIQVRRLSCEFHNLFSEKDPLGLQWNRPVKGKLLEVPHPFFEVYKTLKKHVLQMLSRNHFFAPDQTAFLSEEDLGLLESQVHASLSSASKQMEQNLFILSMIVTLAPFLGLLGTVWGILMTFSHLQHKSVAIASNAAVLSGLSLALSTTVIGLVVAIPALIGYSYLKNGGREYLRDLEGFAYLLLTSVELHYRKPKNAKISDPVS